MVKAIVYVSETGHTKQYAELLGQQSGLSVYELREAVTALPKGTEILYLGWLMAGKVKGLAKASKTFGVKAVCGVGMSGGNTQLNDIKKANRIGGTPVFYLQGGFELEKLHGIHKLMMKTMKATVGKGLSQKQDRTPMEEDMLQLMLHGGNLVSADRLTEVLQWLAAQ